MSKIKTCKKQIRIAEQYIALVKFLSSNNENERNKALKKTKRVLEYRSQVQDCDFSLSEARILWKGLFYCIWMADKPLYQEQVAESISQLVHCFRSLRHALTFEEAFFATMSHAWLGIDQFRMDKYLMLVRRMVRQSMCRVRHENWSPEAVTCLANCYANVLRKSQKGLVMQLTELYLTELAKVSEGKLNSSQVFELVKPFAEYFVTQTDGHLISQVIVPIFFRLIEQTDIGIEHQLRWEAWRDRGFPGGSIDVMEKVEDEEEVEEEEGEERGVNNCEGSSEDNGGDDDDDDDDDDNDNDDREKVLDPRAGRVDVELATLNIDPRMFVKLFSQLKERKDVTQVGRNQLTVLIKKYTSLAEGKFPLGMQKVDLPPKTNWKNVTKSAAKQLAVDLLDDELTKLESLSAELQAAEDSVELATVVGRWAVEPANSAANRRRKKSMRRRAAKRGGLHWTTTATATTDNDDVSSRLEHPAELGSQNEDVSLKEEEEKIEIKRKRKLKEGDDEGVQCENAKKKKRRKKKSSVQLHTINGGGDADDDWKRALEEGETEIFIPNKKYVQKRKSLGLSTPQSEFIEASANGSGTPSQRKSLNGKEKKVLFVLAKNRSQDTSEYVRTLKTNPEIPYKPEKQPDHPIYKDTGVKSPINPFYKRLGYIK